MKLTIERAALMAALEPVADIIERRNTVPILANVRLSTYAGGLTIDGTDLDIALRRHAAANIAGDGTLTVPAALLQDIVRKLPAGSDVSIEVSEPGRLAVKSGRSRFTLMTLPADDYPEIAAGEMPCRFQIDAEVLAGMIGSAAFAISTEETRYYLNGIFFHVVTVEGLPQLRAVATDGHRLARVTAAAPDCSVDMPGIIVPRKAVAAIGKLAEAEAKAGTVLDVAVSPTKIMVAAGTTTLTSKLIDGTFPDYQRVIPQGPDKRVVADAGDLKAAAGRVATISSERGRAVRIALTPGQMALSVTNPDAGEAREEISVDYDGPNIEIGFNARYLAEILEALETDSVALALSDPGAPAILTAASDAGEAFLTVLMPMRG